MKLDKKVVKFISIIVLFVIISFWLSQISFALVYDPSSFDSSNDTTLSTPIKTIMGKGLRVVQIVAAGVAVIALLIIGIKYVTAGPEGKAVSKKVFVYYIIGLTIVILGSEIIGWIAEII